MPPSDAATPIRGKRVRARAHASIANLGYGFDVFALCVDAGFDEVELVAGGRRTTLEITGIEARGLPTQVGRNTAGVALRRLLDEHGIDCPVAIRLRKGVPRGGLGSSAASAAAAVMAANRLFGLGLTRHQLVPFAAHGETASAHAAHADNVAAALFGGFVVVDPADVTRVLSLRPPGSLRIAIATPRLSISTAAARRVLPRRLSLERYSVSCARSAAIALAMAAGDVAGLGRAIEGSFTDAARSRLVPGFDRVCAAARAAGAAGATLSGAGPSVMAVVDRSRVRAGAVAEAMRRAFGRAGLEAEARVARVAGAAQARGGR